MTKMRLKFKMKRWHDEIGVLHRRRKFLRSIERHYFQRELGKFRKKKPLDCGKTQCKLCHSDKYPKRELSKRDIIDNLSFKEQLKE
jgi:hypothetical protein